MSVLRALTVGALGITIFLAVLVEGVVVSRADVGYVFSKPGRLVRTILAMNVLGPIVAIIVCRLFALHPAVIVVLVTLSMTPVGALFPQGMLGLVRPELGRFFPAAKQWVRAIQQASGRLFLLCLVGFTILGWSRMALIIRDGTLPAIVIISMCGLAVGHLLGWPR